MKYLVPIDLSQNELQNPRMQNLASAPSGPVVGQFYFNTANKKAYVWNGTAWIAWEADTSVSPATTTPKMDGTAAVGASAKYAREDHVHPTDTSRVPTSRTINGKALSSDVTLLGEDITLDAGGAVTVTSALSDLSDALNDKVDKVSGKGLSTNDYTTTEKNKLAGIAAGAEVNVQSNWTQTTTTADDYIKNKPTLGTAAAKNFDTTVTANSSNLITSGAVASAIGAADAMRFKGTIGTGGTVTTLPNSHQRGDTYRVITAGSYAGHTCEIGDLIIALGTSGTSSTDWTVAQTNIDGAITSISGTAPISVTGSGSSRTVAISAASASAAGSMSSSHYSKLEGISAGAEVNQNAFSNVKVGSTTVAADSKTDTLELVAGSNVTLTPDATNDKVTIAASNQTYTSVTGKPTANQTPSFGSTFTISQISQSTTGQISATDRTVTIPNTTATTSSAGLMSSNDKDTLNELSSFLVRDTNIAVGDTESPAITNGACSSKMVGYVAWDNTTGEEVSIDFSLTNKCFSISSPYTNIIRIRYIAYLNTYF